MCRNKKDKRCCTGFWSVNGICKECPIGYFGLNCLTKCPDGYYGRACDTLCNCTDGAECHFVRGCLNFENHTIADESQESAGTLHLLGFLALGSIGTIALITLIISLMKCAKKRTNIADIISTLTTLLRSNIRSDHQVNTSAISSDEGAVGGTAIVSYCNKDVRLYVNEYSTIENLPDYHTLSTLQRDNHSTVLTVLEERRGSDSLSETGKFYLKYDESLKHCVNDGRSLAAPLNNISVLSEKRTELTKNVLSDEKSSYKNHAVVENGQIQANHLKGQIKCGSIEIRTKSDDEELEICNIYETEHYTSQNDLILSNDLPFGSKSDYTELKNNTGNCNHMSELYVSGNTLEELNMKDIKEKCSPEMCTISTLMLQEEKGSTISLEIDMSSTNKMISEEKNGQLSEPILATPKMIQCSSINTTREMDKCCGKSDNVSYDSEGSHSFTPDNDNDNSEQHHIKFEHKNLTIITDTELPSNICPYNDSVLERESNCQYSVDSEENKLLHDPSLDTVDVNDSNASSMTSNMIPYSTVDPKRFTSDQIDNSTTSSTSDVKPGIEKHNQSPEKQNQRWDVPNELGVPSNLRPYSVVHKIKQDGNTAKFKSDDCEGSKEDPSQMYDSDWNMNAASTAKKLQNHLPDIVLSGEKCRMEERYEMTGQNSTRNLGVPGSLKKIYRSFTKKEKQNRGKASTLPHPERARYSYKDDPVLYETYDPPDHQPRGKVATISSRFKSFKEQVRSNLTQNIKLTNKQKEKEEGKTSFKETGVDMSANEGNETAIFRPYSMVKEDLSAPVSLLLIESTTNLDV